MTMSKRVLSIALIVFLPVSGIAASTTVVDLRWQELAPLISGREVEIPLSSGGRARGEVLAVRADSIFMDVKKVSRTNYVKGRQSIERSEIPSLNLRKNTIRWRVVGTTAGIIAGLFAGVAVAFVTGDPGLFFLIEGGLTTIHWPERFRNMAGLLSAFPVQHSEPEKSGYASRSAPGGRLSYA